MSSDRRPTHVPLGQRLAAATGPSGGSGARVCTRAELHYALVTSPMLKAPPAAKAAAAASNQQLFDRTSQFVEYFRLVAFGAAGRTIGCIVRPAFLRLRDRPAHLRGRGQRTPSARDRCTADVERSESGQACALLEAQKHPAGGQSPSGGPTGRSGSTGRKSRPRSSGKTAGLKLPSTCSRRACAANGGASAGCIEAASAASTRMPDVFGTQSSRFLCVRGSIPGGMIVADSDRKGGT
jgi:hypothetical protein